jgi:hypothetical protein
MLRPRYPTDYPDRVLECQEALQPAFQQGVPHTDMLALALAAGWTESDVNAALEELKRYKILELNDAEPQE